jgi:hypothetical protein
MDQRTVPDPIIRIHLALDHMESLLSSTRADDELEIDKREAFYDLQAAVTYLDRHLERESRAALASELQGTGQA